MNGLVSSSETLILPLWEKRNLSFPAHVSMRSFRLPPAKHFYLVGDQVLEWHAGWLPSAPDKV